jgi:hypothetical protein
MLCGKCGKELEPDVRFCPQCGNQIDLSAPPAPQNREKINTWLIPSVLSTMLCCLPLGIVAIVFSSKCGQAVNQGDWQAAREYSQKAKLWFYLAAILGFFTTIFCVAAQILEALPED